MSSLEQFVKVQLADGQVASALRPVPVPYQKMVLVCTHMSRDKRCGRAGPQVRAGQRHTLLCFFNHFTTVTSSEGSHR